MFNKQVVLQQAKIYDSFYLYDENKIIKYTNQLKQDFEGVQFLYSIKTNSNPMVVKSVFSQGFGADAASLAEVMMGNQNGISSDKIQYSAPGKTIHDIEASMGISTIIADSLDEVMRIQEIAKKKGIIVEIGIRINPNFTFYGGSGVPSKFGIDEQQVFEAIPNWKKLDSIKIVGIHVHSRSQELNSIILEKYYENIFCLAAAFQKAMNIKLKFVNMGSGLGIPYVSDDVPLDTVYLGKAVKKLISAFRVKLPDARIFIETGRYAVGKSGVYVTKVLDKKSSYGKIFVILNNTLNGFVRPSLAQLVLSYSADKSPVGSEPLFTSKNAFEFIALTGETEQEIVTLVGNLCTATDIMAKDILIPKLKCGDVIVVTNGGSYAAAISPMQFCSLVSPAQLFLTRNGEVIDTVK